MPRKFSDRGPRPHSNLARALRVRVDVVSRGLPNFAWLFARVAFAIEERQTRNVPLPLRKDMIGGVGVNEELEVVTYHRCSRTIALLRRLCCSENYVVLGS